MTARFGRDERGGPGSYLKTRPDSLVSGPEPVEQCYGADWRTLEQKRRRAGFFALDPESSPPPPPPFELVGRLSLPPASPSNLSSSPSPPPSPLALLLLRRAPTCTSRHGDHRLSPPRNPPSRPRAGQRARLGPVARAEGVPAHARDGFARRLEVDIDWEEGTKRLIASPACGKYRTVRAFLRVKVVEGRRDDPWDPRKSQTPRITRTRGMGST